MLLFIVTTHAQTTIFEENFSSGSGSTPPSGWTNVINPGGDAGQNWVFDDASRGISGAGFSGNYAMLDSDDYGNGSTQNVTLTSEEFNASGFTDLELTFSNQFRFYSGQTGVIEVYNGSSWVNIDTYTSHTNYPTSAERTYNIQALANSATNARIRFVFTASWGYWWAIDNVKVTGVSSVPLIPITITADPKTKGFGDVDPALTYSITSGSLQGGDTLSGSLSRDTGETVGSYTINQGTLNNPSYNITYISAELTITEKDTDGDSIVDSIDIDDDNDGILDTEENCVIPGGSIPAGDSEDWIDGEYAVFGIGENTNGLGYQESGFQQAAYNRGIPLTVLDDSSTNYLRESPASSSSPLSLDDKVYFGINPTSSTNDGEVTLTSNYYAPDYDSGAGVGCSTYPVGRNSEIRTTTSTEFTSGGSSSAIYIIPERGAVTGNSFSVHIDFTSPVYAFSFDLNDVFDTTNGAVIPTYEIEVLADGKLLAFLTADSFSNDGTGTMELYRGDKTTLVNGAINIGDDTEATIGFINTTGVTNVEIKTTIVSGEIDECARDAHGIDSFAYGTTSPNCTAGDIDFDGDGLTNDKDLDSDNDGIPDNIEAQSTIDYIIPTYVVGANGLDSAYENNDTASATGLTPINTDGSPDNSDFTDLDSDNDGLFDTAEVGYTIDSDSDGVSNGTFGNNGLDNSLYPADDFLDVNATIDDPTLLIDTDGDVLTVGDVNYRDTELSGTPMITQIHHSATEKIIEITNIHATNTIQANTVKLSLYSNKTGAQTDVIPNTTFTITSALAPGESILITNTGSSFPGIVNASLTSFEDANDILLLAHPKSDISGQKDWKNRYDTNTTFNNNTSYIRTDEVTNVSKDFDSNQWVAYVDDALDPYNDLAVGGPERHPHDPLISEIATANSESNIKFGKHRFNPTIRTGNSWSNGYPDRTRRVVISENFEVSSERLKARKLTIDTNSKLTISNNLLIVTEDITFGSANDEIRLVGNSQLIQTHTTNSKINGSGKLYVDQNSEIASIYRYNYMSSPVGSGSNFIINNVLKDGTTPTSSTSTPLDIDFVTGYNGAPTDPIKIADYWIYTYASGNGTRSNWSQKKSTGSIPVTDGFTFKGPGKAQNYTYVGTPNDGNLDTAIGGNESYLVGNPFASSISVKKFIEDNINSIDGTLYFWEHAGEQDISSSDTAGHSYSGYIGGYATRNIAMGIAASSTSLAGAYDILVEAENETYTGTTTDYLGSNSVLLDNNLEYASFESINRGVDMLRINYASNTPKNLRLKVDNKIINNYLLPISSNYSTYEIEICIQRNSTIVLESLDDDVIYINNIQLMDDDGIITCAPSVGTGGFTYTSPLEYIAISQGFFISGDSNGGPIVFNNSQREYKTEGAESVFFRNNNKNNSSKNSAFRDSYKLPIIKLGLNYTDSENRKIHRQIGISFNENNTFEREKGYDSELYDESNTDFYWKFPNSDTKYSIAGVQEISKDLEVPLVIDVEKSGDFLIGVDEWNLINRKVYIKDKLTQKYYLLNKEKMSLKLETGTYLDRFALSFEGAPVTSLDEELLNNSLIVFYDDSSSEIVIKNETSLEIQKIELYNLLGQKINSFKDFNPDLLISRFHVKNPSTAVYIAKVLTSKGEFTKKIILK